MEKNYALIKRIENSQEFLLLIKKGLLPLSILDKKVFYEYYMDDLKRTKSALQSCPTLTRGIELSEVESLCDS